MTEKSGHMILNSQLNVEGLDKNLLLKVGYNSISCLPDEYALSAQELFPDLEDYLAEF